MKFHSILLAGLVCLGTATAASETNALQIAQFQRRIQQLDAERAGLVEQLKELGSDAPAPGVTIPEPGGKEPPKKETEFDKILKAIQLRKSLADKNSSELPATFQYIHQRGPGKDTKAFDLGLSADLLKLADPDKKWTHPDLYELGLSGEYHYNSATKAKQDSLLTGLDGRAFLGAINDWESSVAIHLKYKNDRVLAGQGFQGGLVYHPNYAPLAIFESQPIGESKMVYYEWRPEVGFEYESGDGEIKTFHEGDRTSFKASLSFVLTAMEGQLEFNNSAYYWNHLSTSGGYDGFHNSQTYVQSSLLYYFSTDKHFAIGIDYLHGDNASEGKFNASEIDLGLKAKY